MCRNIVQEESGNIDMDKIVQQTMPKVPEAVEKEFSQKINETIQDKKI